MSSFLQNLFSRRAVKHFGSAAVDTDMVLNAMINAPSSFGVQPYKIVVVKDAQTKQQLQAMSYNQPQVAECDTLFIVCARTDVAERAEEFLKATGAENIRQMLTGFISYLPDKTAWAARQAYLALGFGLAAAAELGLASCPMEGFSSQQVKEHLKLADNLLPVAYLAVGSHAEDKSQAEPYPRFRFPESDLVQRV